MKVTTVKMEGHNVLCYQYSAHVMAFKFHLASEVGEPWVKQARAMAEALAKKRGCVIKTVELNEKPWVVDTLVKIGEAK